MECLKTGISQNRWFLRYDVDLTLLQEVSDIQYQSTFFFILEFCVKISHSKISVHWRSHSLLLWKSMAHFSFLGVYWFCNWCNVVIPYLKIKKDLAVYFRVSTQNNRNGPPTTPAFSLHFVRTLFFFLSVPVGVRYGNNRQLTSRTCL